MRTTLVDIFATMGYDADTAADGREAVEQFRKRAYNLALLDIRLPDISGTELLTALKAICQQEERDPQTLFVMATGYASVQNSIEALNEGAYAYVTKPVDLAELQAIFRRAIQTQQLERENRRLFQQLQALHQLTDTALSTLEIDELLEQLLAGVTANLKANAGAILLLDDDHRLRVRSAIRMEGDDIASAVVRIGEGFVGRIAAERRPLVMHAPQLWEEADSVDFRSRGIQTALGVPLLSRGQLVGVAHVDSVQRREFSADEVRLLQVLADRAAVVIDNAQLFTRERALRERTAQREEEARSLRDVANALVASVSLEDRLQTLAREFVRSTDSSRCLIMLREGDRLIPQAVCGVRKSAEKLILRQAFDLDEAGPQFTRLLNQGLPQAVGDVSAAALLPPELARRWKIRSALLVPLKYGGRVTGLVGLDNAGEDRQFSEEQIRMARALSAQAAVAIETGKTFEAERNIARTLQESFLSREICVPHFDIACRYEPASAIAQIGGDYFDFIELGGRRIGIVMADVCGKGLAAAVYTAMAKYMLRAFAVEDDSPASVINRLNRALHNQMSDECMFITLVYGILELDTGLFLYANAAHPPPLLYRPADDSFQELTTTGGMVGAVRDMEYAERTVQTQRGDVIALFTDGVTEARTSEQMLETEGVEAVMRQVGRGSAREIADAIYNRAVEFSSGQLKDDVAIVVIRAGEAS